MTNQYKRTTEPLFFLDRLDRFSPLTCKFFSFGAHVTTPMTQNEIVSVIIHGGDSSRESLNRRLAVSHIMAGFRDANLYYKADNNHSGYWESGFVHCIPRPLTFWNLDDDFETVLKECFEINPTIGASFARNVIFELLEAENLTKALLASPDNKFLHWLDQKRSLLLDEPDTSSSDYRPEETDTYYGAVEETIFSQLAKTQDYNAELIELLSAKAKIDIHYKITILKNYVASDIFPQNDKADGYIINGYKTLMPNDAMRGAIYVGNICQVIQDHRSGKKLIDSGDDIETFIRSVYGVRDQELKNNQYPTIMTNGMASDWITDGSFTKSHPDYKVTYGNIDDGFDMALHPKEKYPQIGEMCLLRIGCRRQDVEPGVVVHVPRYERLIDLRQKMTKTRQYKPGI